jgi:hypothetical protein
LAETQYRQMTAELNSVVTCPYAGGKGQGTIKDGRNRKVLNSLGMTKVPSSFGALHHSYIHHTSIPARSATNEADRCS